MQGKNHFLLIIFILLASKYSLAQHEHIYTCEFRNNTFDTYKIDLTKDTLIFFSNKKTGSQKLTISYLKDSLANENLELLFATNGGIFDKDMLPLGLCIENSKTIVDLNERNGQGNFYLKPNGVFFRLSPNIRWGIRI